MFEKWERCSVNVDMGYLTIYKPGEMEKRMNCKDYIQSSIGGVKGILSLFWSRYRIISFMLEEGWERENEWEGFPEELIDLFADMEYKWRKESFGDSAYGKMGYYHFKRKLES